MISYKDAIKLITESSHALPIEQIKVLDSVGRICATPITSPECIPSFDNSAMDGFALSRPTMEGQMPFQMKSRGVIAAGDTLPRSPCATTECWEIMTGAEVPADCFAVVKVEDTQRDEDTITFLKAPKAGENIRRTGEDIREGDTVVEKGTQIFPEHTMALASLGIERIDVYRKPTVGVLSTGTEFASGSSIPKGKIRNSTAPYLLSELGALGAVAHPMGLVEDNPKAFFKFMEAELEKKTDLIISTGAVSMGRYDFIGSALRDLGAEIFFHKVAIRPGKPILFARVGKTAYFGLPGNPISTAVGLRFFVEPYLRALQGLKPERSMKAVLDTDTRKPDGLRCFFKAYVDQSTAIQKIRVLKGQESFRTVPMLAANAWAVLPEAEEVAKEGSEIEVYPLHSSMLKELL